MALTIVIPTIGRKTYKKAISTVLNQTVPTSYVTQYDLNEDGASITRNKAMKKVKTDWVGFCDDDDWLDLRYHEWLVDESPEWDMVIFQMHRPEGMVLPDHTDVEKLEYNWVGISFALKTKIARRFPFKNMVGEDYDLIIRIKLAGYRIKVSERVAYYIG